MARVSVVVTTLNESRHIAALLASLEGQGAHEVIIVDAGSTDGTLEAARAFEDRLPLRIIERPCGRGEGRNLGIEAASGDLIAFTDGDCRAEAGWLDALAAAWGGGEEVVVAGRTVSEGRRGFSDLHRVELEKEGQDTTWPSCNLAYPAALLRRLGGFDPDFVTAEDIDLNYRAVAAGGRIVHAPDAVIRAYTRDDLRGFLRQAYWNGYGRKQLTRKHGRLWQDYKLSRMVRQQFRSPAAAARLVTGLMGYAAAKAWGGQR